MPSKTSEKKSAVALLTIPKEIIDQFASGPMTADAVNAAAMAGLLQPLRFNSRLTELGARCTLLKTQLDHRPLFTTQMFVGRAHRKALLPDG